MLRESVCIGLFVCFSFFIFCRFRGTVLTAIDFRQRICMCTPRARDKSIKLTIHMAKSTDISTDKRWRYDIIGFESSSQKWSGEGISSGCDDDNVKKLEKRVIAVDGVRKKSKQSVYNIYTCIIYKKNTETQNAGWRFRRSGHEKFFAHNTALHHDVPAAGTAAVEHNDLFFVIYSVYEFILYTYPFVSYIRSELYLVCVYIVRLLRSNIVVVVLFAICNFLFHPWPTPPPHPHTRKPPSVFTDPIKKTFP